VWCWFVLNQLRSTRCALYHCNYLVWLLRCARRVVRTAQMVPRREGAPPLAELQLWAVQAGLGVRALAQAALELAVTVRLALAPRQAGLEVAAPVLPVLQRVARAQGAAVEAVQPVAQPGLQATPARAAAQVLTAAQALAAALERARLIATRCCPPAATPIPEPM